MGSTQPTGWSQLGVWKRFALLLGFAAFVSLASTLLDPALVSALVGVSGASVSAYMVAEENKAKENPQLIAAALFLCAILGGISAWRISNDSNEQSNRAQKAMARIEASSQQIAETSKIIHEEAKQTLANQKQIAENLIRTGELQDATLNNVTGGDSFAYVMAIPTTMEDGTIPLKLVNHGKYPLVGVTVQFQWGSPSLKSGAGFDRNLFTPPISGPMTLAPGDQRSIGSIDPTKQEDAFDGMYMIALTIRAQNGSVEETISFKKNDVGWWSSRFNVRRTTGSKTRVILDRGWSPPLDQLERLWKKAGGKPSPTPSDK